VTQKFYPGSNRFHTVNLALGVSIFNGAAKARIKAGERNLQAAAVKEQQTREEIDQQRKSLLLEWSKNQEMMEYYRRIALPQATLIQQQSQLAYKSGDIGYTEWLQLMKQAGAIRNGYYDVLMASAINRAEWAYLHAN
jgi:cobalt-zinc-cadmium resistance protein CzcA